MSAQVYSLPGQAAGRRKAFLERASLNLSSKLSLTCGGNVSYYWKCSSSYPYSAYGNREHPGNFQNKSVTYPFNWVFRYILFFGQTEGERKAFFWRVQERGHIVRLTLRALGCHKGWKRLSFCEIWNNPTPPLRPPYK